MTRVVAVFVCLLGFAYSALGADSPLPQPLAAEVVGPVRRKIQVCFVLDTTGSMSGLIEGAKTKIWSIANEIASSAKPKPRLEVALLPYRDRGDEYVTNVFDLTDDLDEVFKNLQSFNANGGNDEPESVNQALAEAVDKIKWDADRKTVKIIFLVGDAPPHMDYADDVKYPDVCKNAMKKDLIINAIQCGNTTSTTPIWQEIARGGEGSFIQLGQTGDMVAIATPVDKELEGLNVELNKTVIPYGAQSEQAAVGGKLTLSTTAGGYANAERLRYNYSDSGKVVQGNNDLTWFVANGDLRYDDIKVDQLPDELKKMTPEQRKTYIEERQKKRTELQQKLGDLTQKRDAYIAQERARLSKEKKADAFDEKVAEVVKEQAERKK